MSSTTSLGLSPATVGSVQPDGGLSLDEYTRWLVEIQNQPAWRAKADRWMDYVDGNQLDSDILQAQAAIGMPPAIEPLIGPAVDSVTGLEAKTRTDWRLTADNDLDGAKDVADALNFKLNQAERQSGADKACTDAFKPQFCVGIGWVEVARETNPFKFPYRCTAIPRNEIHWDMLDREPGLPKARWLIRRRWSDVEQVKLKFPAYADLIERSFGGWTDQTGLLTEGGQSTTLGTAWDDQRGWSIEEQEWRDVLMRRVCLFEVWYRRWKQIVVLRLPDGRVVEYDKTNALHVVAVASGRVVPMKAVVARMYLSYWMGPHKLHDDKTPYKHDEFPYVQFIGQREDRTGVPYGAVKGMIYLQDAVNSAISKIRWGLSAVTVTRTKGAYSGTDEQFRQMISRVDADIVLDDAHMAKPGAKFEVKRDFQLNEQQYKMLNDSRAGIQRASGVTLAFEGQTGTARSGIQESTQIEQATQALATLMDNFKFARTKVGELLLSLIIEDMVGKPETVVVKSSTGLRQDRTIALNQPAQDPDTGVKYLTNDVERIKLKVAMNDVPSTPSFRSQQLAAMSEAFKSMPQEFQVVALPHLLALMDVPNRDELIEDIKKAQDQLTPEMVQQKIDAAVKQALEGSDRDLRARELDLKYAPDLQQAQIAKLVSETVMNNLKSFFASMQAAEVAIAIPGAAPTADSLMKDGGFQAPNPAGVTPGFPLPSQPGAGVAVNPVKDGRTGVQFTPPGQAATPAGQAVAEGAAIPHNTDPLTPALPASPFQGPNKGIETVRSSDNLPAAVSQPS